MMPGFGLNGSTDHNSQSSRTTRNTYGTNWNGSNNIWAPPIGSELREPTRQSSRPPPLSGTAFGSDGLVQTDESPATDRVTGSGSLLTSSEGEGWSHRWPPLGSAAGINNVRGRPSNHQSGTSPVRNRTNQHTRESSPYYSTQPSAIGTAFTNPPTTSLLDPTTNSFAPRNNTSIFNTAFSPRSDTEDTNRRQHNGFSTTNINGTSNYSGYASSAASRNGSLPPSRHGMDPPSQFGDFGMSNPATIESILLRNNQPSRNSNVSTNGHTNGLPNGRVSNHAWQASMGDLSSNMSRMDIGRQAQDRPSSSHWDPLKNMSSPGSVNGTSNYNYQRSGSLSMEPGTNLLNPSFAGYGQQRFSYNQDGYSPTGSDQRAESPMYLNNQTPPPQDWPRGISSHNSRTNLSNYNGYGPIDRLQLDRALNQVADSQSYQPSPALSHRSLYSTNYNMTGSSTPNFRMPPQISSYYAQQAHGMPYGQSLQSARHPPRGPAAEAPEKKGSPFLQEFHASKGSKKYELREVYGHIVEFSGDQHGSRYLQDKLQTANSDEKAQVFAEIMTNPTQLMTDLFGNYVIQKFFDHGNQQQKRQLADQMRGSMQFLSMQMYACRVVQKALEVILVDQQASLIRELDGKVIKCVKDQNGNHVIQKAIERIPSEHIIFITSAFTGQVHNLATHNYGCRVIQRMLESSHEPAKTEILDELQGCLSSLLVDQFGNYVTQNIVKHGRPSDRDKVIAIVTSNLVSFATQKFASNVVETAFVHGSYEQRQKMIGVATSLDANGDSTLVRLMRDQYGNYIIQRFIKHLQDVASVDEYDNFAEMLQPQLEKLKVISYGKQIGQIEKLLTSPRPVHTAQPSPLSQEVLVPLDIPPVSTPPLTNEEGQSPRSSSHPSTSHSTSDDGDTTETIEVPQKTTRSGVEVSVQPINN